MYTGLRLSFGELVDVEFELLTIIYEFMLNSIKKIGSECSFSKNQS